MRLRATILFGLFSLSSVIAQAVPARDAAHMNAVPQFAVPQDRIRWDRLPLARSTHVSLFEAKENEAGYNMHPSIAYYEGRWWAMWSCGIWGEDMPGQKVMMSTSSDGVRWTSAEALAVPDKDCMLTPTGFWVRGGELLAMAIHRKGKPVVDGKRQQPKPPLDHTVRIFRRGVQGGWTRIANLPDTFNDKPIERMSWGEWAMIRSTSTGSRFFSAGGNTAPDDWKHFPIPAAADGHRMSEAHLFEMKDGGLTALFRDNSRSNWIYRAFSDDRGRTWTAPVATDFPDQTAKFSVLHLSTGLYILVSNPRKGEERFPLCMSVYKDGIVFDRTYVIASEKAPPRFPNFTKRHGAQYPQVAEAGGVVMIIYSVNQESIEVARMDVKDIH